MKYEVFKNYTKALATESEVKLEEPSLYIVFMYNDDFTPMEFVLGILEKFFYMDRRRAANIMMEAHLKGQARCGMFTREVAETKIAQVIDHARMNEHPLLCSMEVA